MDITSTNSRYEAMKRRDVKRMTRVELDALAAALRLAVKSLESASLYEATSKCHPVALKHEEFAETQIDAAILYLAHVRSRIVPGPTMRADGSIEGA